jgi:Mor family transcriptional regulator
MRETTAHIQTDSLVDHYEQGESASSLARRFRVSVWTVINRLRATGVKVRSSKRQNERWLGPAKAPYCFRELVDGLLLGDGQVDPKSILRLEQCNARLGWLLQVRKHLRTVGCTSKLLPIPSRKRSIEGRKVKSRPATLLYTPAYEELHDERRRWYPRGKKLVPRDLVLTKTVLLYWFCGDGTHDGVGHLLFCTQGFRKSDVDFLVSCLKRDLGIHAGRQRTHRKGQFTVTIQRHDEAMKVKKLLDPLIDRSCLYKLQDVRPKKRMGQFSDKQVRRIRKLSEAGATSTSLAKKFEVSVTAISNIVNRKVYREVT